MGHIFHQLKKHAGLALTVSMMLVLSSCGTSNLGSIKTGVWYYNRSKEIAMKFDQTEQTIKGQTIRTDKAVADLTDFEAHQRGKRLIIKPKSGDLPRMHGKLLTNQDAFTLSKRWGQSYEFKEIQRRPYPLPPYRYREPIRQQTLKVETVYGKAPGYYSSLKIEDKLNIDYGQIVLDVAGNIQDNLLRDDINLLMDIYLPESDPVLFRPLVVLIHGGAFVAGDKSDKLQVALAMDLARRGYVVASINYRMGFVFLPGMYSNLERGMYRATQDVRAALRYLSTRSAEFRIDPNMVFLGGNSAGGFLSMLTAFMKQDEVWPSASGSMFKIQNDLGCLDCSTNTDIASYQIKGVINLWGAIPELDLIDPYEKIPMLLIHGDQDKVIPMEQNYPFTNVNKRLSSFFSKKTSGSVAIAAHATKAGIPVKLRILKDVGHEPHIDASNSFTPSYDTIASEINSFLYKQLFPPLPEIIGNRQIHKEMPAQAYTVGASTYTSFNWDADGGLILRDDAFSTKVVWFNNATERHLTIAGNGFNGQIEQQAITIEVKVE